MRLCGLAPHGRKRPIPKLRHEARNAPSTNLTENASYEGKWYFENIDAITGARFDHLDPAFGARLKIPSMEPAQATLYARLGTLLQRL